MRTFPLSAFQTDYWNHDRRRPGSPAVILRSFELTGPLDRDALQAALAASVARHESLRTRCAVDSGVPCQVVEDAVSTELRWADLGSLDPTQRAAEIGRWERAERRTPFELTKAPLWRVTLLRCTEQQHVLLVAVHHIVADGWSMSLLADDLAAGAGSDRTTSDYRDVVDAERTALDRELGRATEYWRSRLIPLPAPVPLPVLRPRAEVREYRGRRREFHWPAPLPDRVRALARAERVSPYMVLLTAFLAALRSVGGTDDIAVASLLAGRDGPGSETVIGLLARVTVLRPEMSDDPTGSELLSRVRGAVLDAHDHAAVPLRTVVDRVVRGPGAPTGGSDPAVREALARLFEVWFNLVPEDTAERTVAGALMRPRATAPDTVVRDERDWDGENLTLTVTASGADLAGHLDVNAALLTDATAQALLDAFRRALDRLIAHPGSTLSKL